MISEKDFLEDYKKEMEVYKEEDSYVNPLRVFESYYFHKGGRNNNYRDEAINRCLEERTNFSSTENNKGNIMKDFIFVKCPECKKDMVYWGNDEYRCDCGNKIQIYLDEFTMEFSKKPWFKVEALEHLSGKLEGQIIVPIKAWFNEDDEEGEVVAHMIKHNRKIGDKYFVNVRYLKNRARTDEKVEALVTELFETLQNE